MIRLFQTNEIRQVTELEGIWDFDVVKQDQGDGQDQPNYVYRLPVPGCWETHPELLTYRGSGVYRKMIEVDKQTHLRFVFKGISHTAKVYWDGEQVAGHYNAYTAFAVVIQDVEPGSHELKVYVDNSFNEQSALHTPNDYYTYGGLIRPVVMEQISDAFIERIQFTPSLEEGIWQADIQVTVSNVSSRTQTFHLKAELAKFELDLGDVTVNPGGHATVTRRFSCPNVDTWSEDHPQLYLCKVQVFEIGQSEPMDDLIERVGFRTISTNHSRIQLNGEDIILKGFNRHEDHPMVGAAFPLSLMVTDLDLMEDMGANCVRTSHYPNDERFLDLCDERGIFVWEENHARGFSLDKMQHPMFSEQCEAVNKEMVEQHVNHPSIVIWGILNECASNTEEGRLLYKQQLKQIRSMDASRPLTFASHHRDKELCFDLVDIVSVNLYPGWYGDEDPGELCDQARGWADAAGGAGKPMIMSEFGGDGYYGHRDPSRVRGTEERHADIIEANLAAYTSRPFISGMLIWQFCDCRVTEGTGWLLTRAMTQNSKGIVDRYRRPKLAYSVVKAYFNK
jgi:beta-glucuronidase